MATAGGKLTAVAIKAAGTGKLADGGGRFLDVRANGSRYWRMKYRHAGKERLLAFGAYPEVTLAEARRRRDAAREAIRGGRMRLRSASVFLRSITSCEASDCCVSEPHSPEEGL